MDKVMWMNVIKKEGPEQTSERIMELYEVIERLSKDDAIKRACLGILGEDEELPVWVRWEKVLSSINFVWMIETGAVLAAKKENQENNLYCLGSLSLLKSDIIYLPHPSLWKRSLQRRPQA